MAYSIQLEHDSLLLFIYHIRNKFTPARFHLKLFLHAVCTVFDGIILFHLQPFPSCHSIIFFLYIVKKKRVKKWKRLYKVFCSTSVKIIFVNKVILSVECSIVNAALVAGALLLFGGGRAPPSSAGFWIPKMSRWGRQRGAQVSCRPHRGPCFICCEQKRLQPPLAVVYGLLQCSFQRWWRWGSWCSRQGGERIWTLLQ